MMKFNYRVDNVHTEQLIGFLTLGVLYSLEKELISIDDAEGFIFMPSVVQVLKEAKLPEEIINIVASGCELDDIADIVPDRLMESIKELIARVAVVIKKGKKVGRLVNKDLSIIES